MPVILSVQKLSHQYADLKAVDKIDLDIIEGECLGILGPNGAGKSTTLEILEGIIIPTAGKVLYKNHAINKHYKQQIGIQFQSTSLPDYLTVKDTLELFANFYKKTLPIAQLIELCQLSDILHQTHFTLSGGQRQRLLLALSLVNDPSILFLDEPTTGLDPQARVHFWQLVEQIKQQGKTIILTTHYMEEAQRLCDRVAIMDQGKFICEGTPQALIHQHFYQHILELPDTIVSGHVVGLLQANDKVKFKKVSGNYLIEYNDIEAILPLLSDVESKGITMRQPHLEDLFMKLTGSELRA
ncbi:ABC transporter ATP-binding protein [Shewanella sp. KT0246]|uniref:ABC transporter ATP-binding protein n=1 Tax=Shewanella sp. KT0246 TaxID=2815912 RepID=UPI001BBEA3A2|nr:ABC transporter ATP-binding protein [Shewanella sp. KT0246]GIU48513.1 ABC transporter ATP-binding protein [Shewanella sp. KT0246]